jgi:dihydroorotase
MILFQDIEYVNKGRRLRGDILVDQKDIVRIEEPGIISCPANTKVVRGTEGMLLLPGVIDEHVHSREPGMLHKGNLTSETKAAAAGGVTSILDMPNVNPPTTTMDRLVQRFEMGSQHSYVNYSFYFGATNKNTDLLPRLNPMKVPAVKLFMGSSTGGMLVDRGESLHAVFEQSPLPIMTHCEDTDIITENLRRAKELYGDDPDVIHHPEIRSREACIRSSKLAAELARRYEKRLHIAHVTTAEELSLAYESETDPTRITLEACVPHLLFCDEDYEQLGTRIKCNPSVKSRQDRNALRAALSDGRITTIATDHAPHLLSEKQGGCAKAASGMPMVQFSLPSMLQLVDEGVLTLERMVQLMCHNPADYFSISDRGYIQEGFRADLVLVQQKPWLLTKDLIVSHCGWSPLEGRSFNWKVVSTYCNGRHIYHEGVFADGNSHAERLLFNR